MQLTFLKASDATPLAKSYSFVENSIEVQPYPNVREFSSVTIEVDSIIDAYESIKTCAAQQLCLLKGNLDRPITEEPRANRTNPMDLTRWIALDLDFEDGFDSVDDFLKAINLDNISYILHHSSSAGVTHKPGLRAHIYMQLERGVVPNVLKSWLRHLNLNVDGLSKQITLSASKMSLRWPLDVTTCQNDKLLYIADPITKNLDDPMKGQRFELHERENVVVPVDRVKADLAVIRAQTNDAIKRLRTSHGLGRAKVKTRWIDANTELLLNPEPAVVTGEKHARGFTYLNLNNGDSWAYYYPDDKPDILYNFKGEPAVRLKDIVPDYAASIQSPDTRPLDIDGYERFCVRDNKRDQYFTALRDLKTNYVDLSRVAKQNLGDFMGVAGLPVPDPIPEYVIEFNPTTNETFNADRQWINVFKPTSYMTMTPKSTANIPPTIDRVLTSITGDDDMMKNHFINWLAFIFQFREKTQTAWVMGGNEGTGKGVFFEHVLRPLFGYDHTRLLMLAALKDTFNDWEAETLIACIDEVYVDESDKQIPEKLRNKITEHITDLRGMHAKRMQVKNYLNLILYSNRPDMMKIPHSDRRYNVCPPQLKRLDLNESDILQIGVELPEFASFLHNYQVDRHKAHRAIDNEAKQNMRIAAEGTGERIFRALREGDLQFFIDMMDEQYDPMADRLKIQYNETITEWYKNRHNTIHVTLEKIRILHRYLTGGKITPVAVLRLANTHLQGWPQARLGYMIDFQPPKFAPPNNTGGPTTNVRRLEVAQ